MNISIIGTGYVGLVTGVCLADKGHAVTCVDLNEEKVAAINAGETPIYEPGLTELLDKHIHHHGGNLSATTDLEKAVLGSELTFIAVGTPFDGKTIDLTFIRRCAAQIGAALRKKETYHVVVVKSTVVPGTTDGVVLPILEKESGKRAGGGFGVGMNPEFLSEGSAVADFLNPDRIILGGNDERTQFKLNEVYASFTGVPMLATPNTTAEMIKYASNALQATLISFSNEIGNLCSDLGDVDSVDVMKGVHLSQYLHSVNSKKPAPIVSFISAGCGFGGSCFPKDVKALVAHGQRYGSPMSLLTEVLRINEEQPERMVRLLKEHVEDLRGMPVTILGLAFKPETDDVRETPALPIIDLLLAEGAKIFAYDPVAMPVAKEAFAEREITYCDSLEEALERGEALVLVTSWKEFAKIPEMIKKRGLAPILIDGRRQLAKDSVKHYAGIGL